MFLIAAGLFALVFLANVIMGATANSPFVGDIGEMLLLLGASITFVVAILKREAAASPKN